ncbi:hypothetical protein [Streptomyces longispororuber]|uniref:hypothetical protein n=1 Tax=Streptomyces longispororuber TaxID=68230 RepID=UPI0036F93B61
MHVRRAAELRGRGHALPGAAAVATGRTPVDELREAGADGVLAGLMDTDEALAAIVS